MKVAIASEFYPRAHDPVLGVWAHRQALAARDAGADVRVLVLHRPVPPRATRLRDAPGALHTLASQPRRAELDGLERAGRRSRRDGGPAHVAGVEQHLHLDGGVAARVEDLASDDVFDGAHRRTIGASRSYDRAGRTGRR